MTRSSRGFRAGRFSWTGTDPDVFVMVADHSSLTSNPLTSRESPPPPSAPPAPPPPHCTVWKAASNGISSEGFLPSEVRDAYLTWPWFILEEQPWVSWARAAKRWRRWLVFIIHCQHWQQPKRKCWASFHRFERCDQRATSWALFTQCIVWLPLMEQLIE